MERSALSASMYELISHTSTVLPRDVTEALKKSSDREESGSIARETLDILLASAQMSRDESLPLCQDTGALFAVVRMRPSNDLSAVVSALTGAARTLTGEGILRQNCVDPVTEKNTGDNTGAYVPQIHVHPWDGPTRISVMLKGGGSENVSTQYSLPLARLSAGRDFEGVRRCVLDAVYAAQGQGCAPGILGVCIGSDRGSGYLVAKEQLFRRLDDTNPIEALNTLETEILEQANTLGIGPMGLGGNTTLLGVKIGAAGRHPACYFVTVSYSCWATRRYTVELADTGEIETWL